MNTMKNIYKNKQIHFFLSFLLMIVLSGCSSNSDTKTDTSAAAENFIANTSIPQRELLTVKDTINAVLSDAMERLRYWDNSGLYENEFSYLTDETTFDEYLKFGQISYHNPQTVIDLVVDSIFMFAHDSAETFVTITLEDAAGKTEQMTGQRLITYYSNGKWIKPTVSVIKYQAEYEELIKQAEEALKWEDQ